jgi:hypothetical protein
MHEIEFQRWSALHDLHTFRQELPLNSAIRGVQQVSVNKYIREKDMHYDMIYSLNKWKNMMAKVSK